MHSGRIKIRFSAAFLVQPIHLSKKRALWKTIIRTASFLCKKSYKAQRPLTRAFSRVTIRNAPSSTLKTVELVRAGNLLSGCKIRIRTVAKKTVLRRSAYAY